MVWLNWNKNEISQNDGNLRSSLSAQKYMNILIYIKNKVLLVSVL